jgi:cellulose synthase/poly-beta-1,6-N-acetylglucosamine synthase-like glycosyltransferase
MANLSNQPHLSVVIPTLGRPILVQTLQSLVRCTGFEELEVLVCGRLHDKEVHAAVTQLASLHPNIRHLEVSFPVGDSSEKKNAGWRGARSDLVAFLDDDVVVARDWPLRMREPFAKADTAVVSGPSLVPPEVGLFARLAGLALASPAAGYVAARYRVAGSAPVAIGWSKIIGCNMCYRRNVLETLGGFDPAFWPGEEMIAAFRVQQGGSRLLFYAAAWVYHYPRQSFRRFWRQIHGYGATRVRLCRGGVEIEPTTFVPAPVGAVSGRLGQREPVLHLGLLAADPGPVSVRRGGRRHHADHGSGVATAKRSVAAAGHPGYAFELRSGLLERVPAAGQGPERAAGRGQLVG